MLIKKLRLYFLAISLILPITALAVTPGKAIISPMETFFAMVEIDHAATSNVNLVAPRDFVVIPVHWYRQSGSYAETWQVLLNNKMVHQETIAMSSLQQAATNLRIYQAGKYNIAILLCHGNGEAKECSRSDDKHIIVADTDGSYLPSLPIKIAPTNNDILIPNGMVLAAYFAEPSVYGRRFSINQVPAQNLTHLLYGPIVICAANPSLAKVENGYRLATLKRACDNSPDYTIAINDLWAATQMPFPHALQNLTTPYLGSYGQMMLLKQSYPNLKIIASIGGWLLSDPFHDFNDKTKRDIFIASVAKFLSTWQFYDGIDISWLPYDEHNMKYSNHSAINTNLAYIELMAELRMMLNDLSNQTNKNYQLLTTIAPYSAATLDYAAISQHTDYIFTTSYDFFTPKENSIAFQLALDCGLHNQVNNCSLSSADQHRKLNSNIENTIRNTVNRLLEQGVDANKLIVGVPMYARGWAGVFRDTMTDPTNPMTATATARLFGSWQSGIIDYKDVIERYANRPNIELGYDELANAAYAYDPINAELLTYENKQSVIAKGEYVKQLNLGGLFAWDIDADNGDLMQAMQQSLADDNIDISYLHKN